MKYELSDQVVKNLVYFLDQVTIKGHQQRVAMNQICDALSRPIPDVPTAVQKQTDTAAK